ncbi:MAG: VOC family protein [Pseudomonadales bacterium]
MENGRVADVFGSLSMGYFVAGARNLAGWKRFGSEAMGLHLAHESQDHLGFRLDEHARRIIIEHSDVDDVIALGWQLDNQIVLDIVLERLKARGVTVEFVQGDRASERGVAWFHRFVGPKGLLIELFVEPLTESDPLQILSSGFKIGSAGLGHISVMSRERDRTIAFWREVFDARLSDRIEISSGKRVALDVTFLRINERHHSVAIAATRGPRIDMFPTRVQHFNIEVATLDDLTTTFERCQQMGYKISRNIGRHPNDKELSFYLPSPSGFDMEIGWDALVVDEAQWRSESVYDRMSNWGHEIPGTFSTELGFRHVVHGIKSLGREEFLPW